MSTCCCPKETGEGLSAEQIEKVAAIFKALGHPVRLGLALKLLEGERCVCELHEGSERDLSTISTHLSTLKTCGVLRAEQRGKNIFYSLSCDCLKDVITCLSNLS